MPKANAQPAGGNPAAERPRSTGGTRDALLAATATAIARYGWTAVTTRQVAALAGVNPALVHYHFGSMDDLRRQAVLTALAAEVQGPLEALLVDGPVEEAIEACLAAVVDVDRSSDRSGLLYEAMLGARRDEELRAALAQAYDEFRAVLADRIRRADAPDPEAAAIVITAALDGLLLHRMVAPDLDVSRLTETLTAVLRVPGRPAQSALHAGGTGPRVVG